MRRFFEREPSMNLYRAILSLEDEDSCYRFFKDLCSIRELQSMEQRFDVAKLLYEGKVYTEIVDETGASSATISRVNRALKYGTYGLMDAMPSVSPDASEKDEEIDESKDKLPDQDQKS